MKILKVLNLISSEMGGTFDYKGLDKDQFVPGSPLYPPAVNLQNNFCYVITEEENIPDSPDIIEVTQEEYEAYRDYLTSYQTKSEIELLQEELAEVKSKLQIATETIDFLLGV
jgi:hypothetical protein